MFSVQQSWNQIWSNVDLTIKRPVVHMFLTVKKALVLLQHQIKYLRKLIFAVSTKNRMKRSTLVAKQWSKTKARKARNAMVHWLLIIIFSTKNDQTKWWVAWKLQGLLAGWGWKSQKEPTLALQSKVPLRRRSRTRPFRASDTLWFSHTRRP